MLVETIIPTVARILPQVLVCNNLSFVFEIMEWNEKHKNTTLSEQFQNPIEKLRQKEARSIPLIHVCMTAHFQELKKITVLYLKNYGKNIKIITM